MRMDILASQEFKKELRCSLVYDNGPFSILGASFAAKGKTVIFRVKLEILQDTIDPYAMFVHLVKNGRIAYNMDFAIVAAEPRGSGMTAGNVLTMHHTVELPKAFDLLDADRIQFGMVWKSRQGDRRLWVKNADIEMMEEGTSAVFKLA